MFAFLNRTLTYHWLLTFIFMGLFAAGFGLTTINLFNLLNANFAFIREYGWLALSEGGLMQLVELSFYIYVSTLFFLLYKVCEYALVQKVMSARKI